MPESYLRADPYAAERIGSPEARAPLLERAKQALLNMLPETREGYIPLAVGAALFGAGGAGAIGGKYPISPSMAPTITRTGPPLPQLPIPSPFIKPIGTRSMPASVDMADALTQALAPAEQEAMLAYNVADDVQTFAGKPYAPVTPGMRRALAEAFDYEAGGTGYTVDAIDPRLLKGIISSQMGTAIGGAVPFLSQAMSVGGQTYDFLRELLAERAAERSATTPSPNEISRAPYEASTYSALPETRRREALQRISAASSAPAR